MTKMVVFLLYTLTILMAISLFYHSPSPTITGFATYALSSDVKSIVQSFTEDKAFSFLGEGAAFCIVVEIDNQTTYYYEIVKYKKDQSVEEKYCADPGKNNIIVKFNSYDALLEFKSDPKKFIVEKRNIDYYIFPSNYVYPGGVINCPIAFQLRYCGAFQPYFKRAELADIQMPCCAYSKLTPAGLGYFLGGIVSSGWFWFVAILAAIVTTLIILSRKKEKNF